MKKKTLKNKKEVKKDIVREPANYVVIEVSDYFMFYSFGDNTNVQYFNLLEDVVKYVAKLSNPNSVRVFKIEQELKTETRLKLDLK
jgi:hypothetical protein